MGRNPQIKTRLKDSTARKRSTGPKVSSLKLIKPPKEISDRCKWLFEKIQKSNSAEKILDELDSAALMVYCETWSKWLDASKKCEPMVVKTKSGNIAVNPYVWIFNALNKTLTKLASELGMTPVGRARMAVEIMNAESDWDEFVKRKRERLREAMNNTEVVDEGRDMEH